jgi:hypothetical protein
MLNRSINRFEFATTAVSKHFPIALPQSSISENNLFDCAA